MPQQPGAFRRFVTVAEFTDRETGEDDAFVRFRSGEFSYVGYYGLGNKFNLEGLAVFKGEKLLKKFPCLRGSVEWDLGFNDLLSLGVAEKETIEQRIWKALLPSSSVVYPRHTLP